MLYVEPARPPGLVTSQKTDAFIRFLEASGGAPPDACCLIFKKAWELFKKARGAGYAVAARLGGETLWLPVPNLVKDPEVFVWQRALGWFAARLVEAGGRFEDGAAHFPSGQVLTVTVREKGRLVAASSAEGKKYAWDVESLKTKKLSECVRRIA